MGPSLLRSLFCALLALLPALVWAQAPNLEVTVTPSGATTVTAGNSLTYTVTVRNIAGGTGATTNQSRNVTGRLTFTGVVPTTAVVTPVAPLGSTGAYTGGVASINVGTLLNSNRTPNSQQFTVTVTVPENTAAGTVITVRGSATSGNATDAGNEVNSGNNDGTNTAAINTVTVQTSADVASTITGPTTAAAGSTITYTVSSTNTGPSTAAGVVPTLTLQPAQPLANLTLPSGATYNTGSGVVTFASSSIASGATVTNAVQILLGPGSNLSGQAKNTATTTDPDATDNNGSAAAANVSTTISAQADVATIVTGPTSGTGGQTVTYTVTSVNNGPSTSSNSVATLTLTAPQPAGSVTVTNGSYNATTGIVTWSGVGLANGQTATFTVTVVLPNSGSLAVKAKSTATTADATPGNNDGTATGANVTTTVVTVSDLVTTISGPTSATAGSTFVYTATTTNNGPNTASNVVIRIQFPANFPAASLAFTGASYIQATGVLTFNTVTTQATGVGNALVRTVTVTAPASGSVTGKAYSSSAATDNTPANNDGSATNANVTTTIGSAANLATTLATSATTANSGQNVTLTATTTNGGPSSATSVVVTIQLTPFLPAGSVTVTAGTYNATNGLVTFNSTTLASGANQTNTVVFVAPASGTVTGQAASTSAATDNTPGNNDGSAANANTTTTINTADIQATVVQNNATISAGSSVTYTTTVRNNGGGTATGIVTTLTLSVGGTPPALSTLTLPGGATYNATSGVVTFATLASLNNGSTQTYAVTFASPNSTPGGTLATAQTAATSATTDNTPGNNDGSATNANVTTTINAAGDVITTLAQSTTGAVAPGGAVTYTVTVRNNAGNTAAAIVPTLTLSLGGTPPTLASLTLPTGATYNATTGVVTFSTITTLTNGSQQQLAVTITVPAGTASGISLTGQAASTATSTDTNPTNNNGSQANANVSTPILAAGADVIATISGPTSAPSGSIVYYTVTIANNSLSSAAATDVVPTIQLPIGLLGVSFSRQGTYDPATGIGTWPTIATLNANNSTSYNVSFALPDGGATGIAKATASSVDPVAANNNGSLAAANLTTTPTQVADVTVSVSGPTVIAPNERITYLVSVGNEGPSTATGVAPTLTLPTGLSGVVLPNGGTYSITTGIVTFPVTATLVKGGSLAYLVRLPGLASGSLSGVAAGTATTADGDPVVANNNGTLPPANITTTVNPLVAQLQCASPGRDGSVTTTASSILNTYYPGTLTALANSTSIVIGAAQIGTTPIAAGDLLLVMQMQGAAIDFSNTNSYGDGILSGRASGNLTTSFTAGQYEYVIAANNVPLTGGTLTVSGALVFSYTDADATTTSGQQRYQVIRIPQYLNLTLGADLTMPAWNGRVGGVLPLDVANRIAMGTFKIDGKGKGFRGGAGIQLGGSGTAGLTNQDYRTSNVNTTNASKGEGIAGTPRYVNNAGALLDTRTAGLLPATLTDGYPDGDFGRGAPGNAGGGGVDGRPNNNDENSGGGGGSNAGFGGTGGNSWNSNLQVGGFGGADFTAASPARLIMGGGGGAGTTNNGTTVGGGPGAGFASSGAAGGGIVIARATSVTGSGTIDVSGEDMAYVPLNDASGGGGAGGSVLFLSNGTLTTMTVLARGGAGGSNTGGGSPHGPGGSGAGGVAYTSSPISATSNLSSGANGTTFGTIAYGSGTGTAASGQALYTVTQADAPNVISATNCTADVTATITGPTFASTNDAITYTISVRNLGPNTATGVESFITLAPNLPAGSVSLPTGATYNATTGVVTMPLIPSLAPGVIVNRTITYTFPFRQDVSGMATATAAQLDLIPTNNNGSQTNANVLTRYNRPPVVQNVTNPTPLPSSNAATAVLPLVGSDPEGSAITFTIQALPPTTQGIFLVNGVVLNTTNFPGLVLTEAQAAQLQFDPNGSYSGPVTFNYKATDALNLDSDAPQAVYTLQVGASVDLVTTVTGPTTAVAGATVTYTVSTVNNGPGTAASVVPTITIAPALPLASLTLPTGATYNATSGVVTFATVPTLANGATQTNTVSYVAPAAGGTITGQAASTTPTFDTNTTNNDGSAANANITTVISLSADLATTISGPTTAVAGATVTYTATTTNSGPSTASAVVPTITIAPALPLASLTLPTGATYNSTTGVVTFATTATLNSGASVTNSVSYIAPGTGGTVTGKAANTSATADPTAANNNGTATNANVSTVISLSADLATTISGPTTATAGSTVTYTATTVNNGPSAAAAVVATIQLAPNLPAGSVTVTGGTYNATNGLVTFTSTTSLASGATQTNTVSYVAPASGTVTGKAAGTTTTSDPTATNNNGTQAAANVSTVITPQADLVTTISGPTTANANSSVVYTATTVNNGPSTASTVVVTIQLAPALPSGSVVVTGGSYNQGSGLVTFNTATTLASGATQTNTVTVTMPANGSVTATDRSTTVTADPNATNNNGTAANATVTTVVTPVTDLATTISGPTTANAGSTVTYTATTTNNGPSTATGVAPTITIAPALPLASLTLPTGATYNSTTGVVTFATTATLNSGASVTNSVSYIAPASGPVTGKAANTSTTTDPTVANNNGTATNANISTAITPIADVTTAFTASPTVVNPSTATATYTVTYTNNGPSQAANVTRTVTLPTGSTMTAGQITASGGSYNSTSRVLTFPTLTTLNAGATSTATFAFTASATSGNVSVLSTVGTGTNQGADVAPNTATVPLRVNARPTANAVTNVTLPNTSGATVLNANLSGSDTDGTISSFLIATLPAAGTLAYNGVTLTALNIGTTVIPNTPAGLALLTYAPQSGSTTTATFTYTATDNDGLASAAATYSIPLSAVADVATTITPSVTPVNAGSALVLTVGFVNNGPNTASTVTRQVTLPAGLGVANVTVTNGGTYDNTTGIVTYGNTGTLNNGANLNSTITITRVPLTASIAVTSATSTTSNENGATANNTAAVTVPVNSTAPTGCGISYSGSGSSSGLFTQYFLGYFEDTQNYQTAFFGNTPQLSRTEPTVNFPASNSWGDLVTSGAATGTVADPNTYSARFRGSIYIPTTGSYTFYTSSDDASAMFIDGAALAPTPGNTGNALVKNYGRHGTITASASVTLTAGLHNVLLYFGEDGGGNVFTWEWESAAAGITRQIVPNSALCAGGAGPDLVTVISGPAAVANNQSFTYTVTTTNPTTLSTADATNVVQTIQLAPNLPATAVSVTNGTYNALTGLVTFNPAATLALGGTLINTVTMNVAGLGVLTVTGQAASTAGTTDADITSNNGSQANANITTRISTGTIPPVAQNVTNTPSMSYTAPATPILPLVATDADGVVSTYTVLTLPTAGQGLLYVNGVELNVTNFPGLVLTPTQATQLSFDPARSQYGNITFTYRATDNDNLNSNTATYTIPVTNQAPVANADQNDVPLNTTTTGNVRLNDTDPDGDPLTVNTTLVVAPAHGTVVMQASGAYTYTPVTGYLGPDQFSYSICDGASPALCATGIVNVRVYNPATACASGSGANLLVNSDFNSGTVPGTGAGGFGFTTQYNYVAPGGSLVPENTYAITADPLPYHPAFSGNGRGGATDRFLAINASPDIQVQYSQTVAVQPNRYYTFSAYFQNLLVTGGAVPVVGFVINGQSTSGTVSIPPRGSSASNWIRFSDIWYSGSNTTAVFEIRNLTTDRGGNDLGIDDVYFGTCNLPPVAIADIQNTPPATPITFSITNNDSDGDGSVIPSTVVLTGSAPGTPRTFTDASGNTFVVDALGNLTFTPAAGFFGTASTTYTVQDDANAPSNPALIAVTVQAPTTDVQTSITSPTNGSTIIAGQPQTITVQTRNNGPNPAYNVVQTVDVRPGLGVTDMFVNGQAGTLSGSVITYPGGATYNVTTGLVTFPALATQAVSGSASNTVTFPAPGSGPLAVTANVTHAALDGVPANNTSTVSLTVSARFDLLTTITGPTTAVAGNQVTFSVVTANNSISASAAQTVVQTVQLPLNLAQVFVTNAGTYNPANGVVTFPTVNNLAPGQQQINTISFDAPATGFTATARVTPNTTAAGDINLLNNSASATPTTVNAAGTEQTNPFVTIDASAHYVAPGTPVDILIGTGNLGPDGALGVQVSVQMNPGLTFTNLGGGTYDAGSGMLTFAALNRPNGPMPAGARFSYTATILAPTSGPVLAAAVVNSTTHDVVSGNNFMSTRIDVYPRADLSISLAAPTAVNAGDPLVYTVTTTNLSGLPARNLDQTVQLAPNLTGVTVTGGTYSSTTGLVTLPVVATLAVGASQSYAIALTAPSDITTLRAVANVASETTELLYTNNIATASTTLTPAADVAIAISGPATGVINSPVTYVVTTLNNGPSVAASTTPVVQLPRNLVIVNLPTGATYTGSTGVLTLPTLTNLPSGASSATAFTVVMPDVARLVPTANAQVTAATNDRNLTNNFATANTLSSAPTDLNADLSAAVTVTSGGAPVTTATPTQSLTYTAVFTNNGAGAATSTAPRLALPSGLSAASMTISNGGTYDAASGLVTWPVQTATLDINQSLTYTVTLPAPITGPLVATAIVSSATSDNVPANNTASASVTISPRADVISRVAGPSTAQPGETVTYSVTTLNNGPSSAASVQTTVTLPAGATGVVLPAGATQAGNVVTLPLDAFQTSGTNGQQTYLITFTPAATSTSWTVTSNVSTTTTETNGGNNGGTTTTTRSNVRPVATNVVNALVEPIGNTATAPRTISPLVGADADGTILRYTIVALPASSQGVLYVNGLELNTTNFPGLVLTPTQATQLQFDPASGFTGNVFFQYTTTDNVTTVSLPALYTIPVGRDLDSYYTTLPVGGGPSPYQANQPLANLFDANGGEYTGTNVADTGTRTVTLVPTSTLPLGVGLNPTTGQFFVTNPALLVPGTYVMQVQSVDEFSGTNLATVTLQIGVNPLPVELTRFGAQPRRIDAILDWATAQELHNAFFGIERSLDGGRTFTEIGRVLGAGSTRTAHEYGYVDAGIGRTPGTVYYRLRQVDQDGTFTYSDVRAVRFTGASAPLAFAVWPNPATTTATVRVTGATTGSVLTVIDAVGRVVQRHELDVNTAERPLDVTTLPVGTYLLRLTTLDGQSATQRLVRE